MLASVTVALGVEIALASLAWVESNIFGDLFGGDRPLSFIIQPQNSERQAFLLECQA